MALNKQPISLNFAQGVNTKADPFQLSAGQFLNLQNSIFDKTGRLTKRNGFAEIAQLPNADQTTLTTLNDNLIATGSNLYAFSAETDQWLNQGIIQPVQLTVQSIVRNSTSQTNPDAAVAPSGLTCITFDDSSGTAYYQISNSITGQQIVPKISLGSASKQPRAFIVGQYFIVTFVRQITSNYHLSYIAIPIVNPQSPTTVTDIATGLKSTTAYDGAVANDLLYLGWANSSGQINTTSISSTLLVSSPATTLSHTADLMSAATDTSGSTAKVWFTFWDNSSKNAYAMCFNQGMIPLLTPVLVGSSLQLNTITSVVNNGILNIFYENANTYGSGPNSATVTNYISTNTITVAGAVTSISIILRSVGLASKAFVASNGSIYVLTAYGEQNQPTYFLIDSVGNIYMRLAYSNGGGYATSQILPSVSSINGNYIVPYLYKDLLTTINKGTDLTTGTVTTAVYTQTGVNLATMGINTAGQYSSEIAASLHLTGGMVWQYDSVKPVELGFHVWPENQGAVENTNGGAMSPQKYYYQFTYEWTDNQGNIHRSAPSIPLLADLTATSPVAQSITGNGTAGSPVVTNVSSITGLNAGQTIVDATASANIPSSTTIAAVGTQVTGTYSTSNPTITVASNAGIYVGQTVTSITHPGDFASGTTVTFISGTTITISLNPLASAGSGGNVIFSSVANPTITLSNNVVNTFTGDTLHTQNVTTTATFPFNSKTITVNSTAGLQVGQALTDLTTSGNILGGTTIVAISGNTITLSIATAGASATLGDTLATSQILSTTLTVPTLRLTYKTATNPVRIVGYRWSAAQQVYYQFTSVQSPVLNNPAVDSVTIIDTFCDSQILGNAIIYTTGGVVENICPPACLDSALFNNRLWLIDAEDPNLLWFSKEVLEATPVEMSDLLTEYVAPTSGAQGSTGPMTALSAMDDKLIIFKQDALYYINGIGPDNTGANNGYSDPIFIGSTVGCANPRSIVLTPNGLMFQSDKGIWLLGRDLQTQYIGAPVEAYNSQTIVGSQTIPGTNQVRFVLESNTTLMYDYFFNQWGTFNNIYAISSTLYQGYQTYLNQYGSVLQETPGTYLDGSQPVLMSLTSSWINLAGLQGFERFYQMYLLGTYQSPFKLNVGFAFDYNASQVQQTIVTPDNYIAPWGGEAVWGSGEPWGGVGNAFEARVFPQQQKCSSFQITIQEQYDGSLIPNSAAGLTLSGFNLVIGAKKGWRTQKAGRSFG